MKSKATEGTRTIVLMGEKTGILKDFLKNPPAGAF